MVRARRRKSSPQQPIMSRIARIRRRHRRHRRHLFIHPIIPLTPAQPYFSTNPQPPYQAKPSQSSSPPESPFHFRAGCPKSPLSLSQIPPIKASIITTVGGYVVSKVANRLYHILRNHVRSCCYTSKLSIRPYASPCIPSPRNSDLSHSHSHSHSHATSIMNMDMDMDMGHDYHKHPYKHKHEEVSLLHNSTCSNQVHIKFDSTQPSTNSDHCHIAMYV